MAQITKPLSSYVSELRPGDSISNTVAAQGALTAAASVGVPTKTEFDKVVADAVAARTTLNAVITSLKASGLMA